MRSFLSLSIQLADDVYTIFAPTDDAFDLCLNQSGVPVTKLANSTKIELTKSQSSVCLRCEGRRRSMSRRREGRTGEGRGTFVFPRLGFGDLQIRILVGDLQLQRRRPSSSRAWPSKSPVSPRV